MFVYFELLEFMGFNPHLTTVNTYDLLCVVSDRVMSEIVQSMS